MSLTVYSLTGESEPQRKTTALQGEKADGALFELENILLMGTSVISGSGVALVLRTGDGECFLLVKSQGHPNNPYRCIHRHNHEAAKQEATIELLSAWYSKCQLHDDCVYVGHGPNCESRFFDLYYLLTCIGPSRQRQDYRQLATSCTILSERRRRIGP